MDRKLKYLNRIFSFNSVDLAADELHAEPHLKSV